MKFGLFLVKEKGNFYNDSKRERPQRAGTGKEPEMEGKSKERKNAGRWRFLAVCLPLAALAPLTWLATKALSRHPEFVERFYSRGLFPILSQPVSLLTGWLPISAAELILVFGSLALLASIGIQTYRMFSRPDPWIRLTKTVSLLLALAGCAYCLFYLLWGWNYHRLTLERTLGLPDTEMSTELLEKVCSELIPEAAELRKGLPEDENGCVVLPDDLVSELTRINSNYIALSETYPGLWGRMYAPPKIVVGSRFMSWGDTSGIFIPFTEEANLNCDMPAFLQLSTASHEAAHQRGVAREDEANFMAFLSCRSSDRPEFVYSGTMLALIYCMNELHDDDYDAFARCYSLYSDAQRRDLAQHNAYWKAFEGPVQEASDTMNDNYLKSNAQPEGIRSYDRVVALVLKWYAAEISR